ncbi:hypothetical protein Tsubulata_027014 [Turnera subulata]|uniref:Ricin B lectin domain-containing protein n=1 Tax=Turnera subulata TaxID=218843 RepID=A0A9Q0GEZ9_9ROSI|nr:hypothetical protein Tsubulata_027014 [Turnera subulata]
MNAENCWDAFSQAVVNAQPNGDLKEDDKKRIEEKLNQLLEQGEQLVVNTVLDILVFGFLALLKFSKPKSPHGSPTRALLDVPITIMQQQEYYSRNTNWTVNEEEEITTSISGPNGLCVDVPGGWYYNAAELILWTWRNGACLTYDEAPSRYKPSVEGRVFVEECSASSRYQRWEITGDGGIMNTGTKVFLTVTKDEDEDGGGNYRLTAQDLNNQALSAQSFRFLVSG